MNETTKKLLRLITGGKADFGGAYSIRENGKCADMRSSENIRIEKKTDKPGLDIRIRPNTKGETLAIPACVTHGGVDDLVYNDFYIGEDADVVIVAGCGVHTEHGEPAHTDGEEESQHNGIHRFFLGKNARVKYVEKHIGTGGEGIRSIDPVTEAALERDAVLEMDTVQLGGVDRSVRKTEAALEAGAKLLIRERILTEHRQEATTYFRVELNGTGSGVDLVSRSVARDDSRQSYESVILGNAPCTGHSECDAIIADHGAVDASPSLCARHGDAQLIHEAAIGKIAGEQLLKLQTLGLTEQEAEAKIIEGFLV